MNIRDLRLPIAALLLGASSVTLASDWLWRAQVDLDAICGKADTRVPVVVAGGESRARENSLWREQVGEEAYLSARTGRVVVSNEASGDIWLWRKQYAPSDDRTPRVRISDRPEEEETRRQ